MTSSHHSQQSQPQNNTASKMSLPGVFIRGLLMGAADVVPGVSGGTLALITGIYERLVNGLANITPGLLVLWKKEGFTAFWKQGDFSFLLVLFVGILSSITMLASILRWFMQVHPVPLWAFFFGLISASIWLIGRRLPRWGLGEFVALLVGCTLTALLVIQPEMEQALGMSRMAFFFSGMLAICAMILPGISGSFILLLLGMYSPVLEAIHQRELGLLFFFVLGCALGLLSFVHLLRWTLARYHDPVVALLTGVMMASLWRLWPWHLEVDGYHRNLLPMAYGQHADPAMGFAVMGFLLAIGLVLFLAGVEKRASQPSR